MKQVPTKFSLDPRQLRDSIYRSDGAPRVTTADTTDHSHTFELASTLISDLLRAATPYFILFFFVVVVVAVVF